MNITPLLETWDIHSRINVYLLESIQEEFLADCSSFGGRNVGQQFAHMHNVRLMWLKSANEMFSEGQHKLGIEIVLTKELLAAELMWSSYAMRTLMESCFTNGRIKGFKPHPTAFLGYLIAHESHHRGQIMLALKQSGHAADKKIQFGLWEWGVR